MNVCGGYILNTKLIIKLRITKWYKYDEEVIFYVLLALQNYCGNINQALHNNTHTLSHPIPCYYPKHKYYDYQHMPQQIYNIYASGWNNYIWMITCNSGMKRAFNWSYKIFLSRSREWPSANMIIPMANLTHQRTIIYCMLEKNRIRLVTLQHNGTSNRV